MEFKPKQKKSPYDFHLNCKPFKEHKCKDIGLQALKQAVLESCKLRPSNINRHRDQSLRSRLVKRPDRYVKFKEGNLDQKETGIKQQSDCQDPEFQRSQVHQTEFLSFSNSGGHESRTKLNEVQDMSFNLCTRNNRGMLNDDGIENVFNPFLKDQARDMKTVGHDLPLQEALQAAPTAAHANRKITHFYGELLYREHQYEDNYDFIFNQQGAENKSLVNGSMSKLKGQQDHFIDSEKIMKQTDLVKRKALTIREEDKDTIDDNKISKPVSTNRRTLQHFKTESTSDIRQEGKENICRTANKSRNVDSEEPLISFQKSLRDYDVKKRNDSWREGQERDSLTENDNNFLRRIGGNELDELLVMNQEGSPLARTMEVGHRLAGQTNHPSNSRRPCSMRKATDSGGNNSHEQPSVASSASILNCPNAFSTASLMQKLDEIEHEKFDVAAALRVAKSKGITLSKEDKEQLKIAMQVAEEAEEKAFKKEKVDVKSSKMRYNIPLLKISDPRTHAGPFFYPMSRKARKFQLQNKDLRTIQPALLDLWDSKERCPQVSSSTIVGCKMPSITIKGDGSEHQHTVTDREAMCRAVTNTQALYDSCLYKPEIDFECTCAWRE